MGVEGSQVTIFETLDLSFEPEYTCVCPKQIPTLDVETIFQVQCMYRDKPHVVLLNDIARYYKLLCSAKPASEALSITPIVDKIPGSRFVEIHCEDDTGCVTTTFSTVTQSTSSITIETAISIPYMVRCERYHASQGEERMLLVFTNQMLRDQRGRLTTKGITYLNEMAQFLTKLERIRNSSPQPSPHTGNML